MRDNISRVRDNMASRRIATKTPGIYYREHATRKTDNGRPDRYWILRYRNGQRQSEEGVGWSTQGFGLEWCRSALSRILQNIKTGSGPRSLRELRQAADARRETEAAADADRALQDAVSSLTFAEAADRFLTWSRSNKKTHADDARNLRIHVLPTLGSLRLAEIAPETVNALKTALEQTAPIHGSRRATLAPKTVLICLGLVREVFNFAAATPFHPSRRDLKMFTGDNPAAFNRYSIVYSLPRVDNRVMRVIFEEEYAQIQAQSQLYSIDQHDAQAISWHTGMRREEIVKLQPEHVSLDGLAITTVDTKAGPSRTVHFEEDLLPILERRLYMPGGWLFPGAKGGCRNLDSLSHGFARVVAKTGLNDDVTDQRFRLTFKSLRASYAVRMLAAGMDLQTLKNQLGHASLEITSKRYLPLVAAYQKEAVARAQRRAKVLDFKAVR